MILLALNELNLDLIRGYVDSGLLPNFEQLLQNGVVETTSEQEYRHLEPWIQWVTVHTGLPFRDHQVFRLGDIVNRAELNQIFEELENEGLSVGAVSPFNADNRLENPEFFIPDPWTQTAPSGSFLVKRLSKAISNFVNNNASGKFQSSDIFWLGVGVCRFVRPKKWSKLIKLLTHARKPGVKAAILDFVLLEVFVSLQRRTKPDYAHVFFNGGAHIQHHYMFNSVKYSGQLSNPEWYCPSDWDPVYMILSLYDDIIGDLLKTGQNLVGLTALSQVPYTQTTYYWRPKNHKVFLEEMDFGVHFQVEPRMSRDFLISLKTSRDAELVERHLMTYVDSENGKKVFSVDNRGESLFVEIVYSGELLDNTSFQGENGRVLQDLQTKLVFVARKNGMHDQRGFLVSSRQLDLPAQIQLCEVYEVIKKLALEDRRYQ